MAPLAAVAVVRLEGVVRVKVVVAQRRVAGAEARVVGVVQLVAVATLAVVGLVLGAELRQLGLQSQRHDNFCTAPGTRCLQIIQNFLSVALSTCLTNCFSCFYFSFSSAQLSSCFDHQQC